MQAALRGRFFLPRGGTAAPGVAQPSAAKKSSGDNHLHGAFNLLQEAGGNQLLFAGGGRIMDRRHQISPVGVTVAPVPSVVQQEAP